MEKRFRILGKLILTLILVIAFIWLITKDITVWQLKQPEGEYARMRDVKILTEELLLADVKVTDVGGLSDFLKGNQEEYLNYGTYKQLLSFLGEEKYLFDRKYKDEFLMLEEDWYHSYEKILGELGLQETIRRKKVEIWCDDTYLTGENRIGEEELLCSGGEIYTYLSPDFKECMFMTVEAFVRENRLLTLYGRNQERIGLENVWVMECNAQELRFFEGTYEISLSPERIPEPVLARAEQDAGTGCREQIADLTFGEGKLQTFEVKEEKAGGKLLSFGDGKVELEGTGILELADHCVGYQLYDDLRTAQVEELAIGYSFADFVLDKGKVCAFLITRKEKMDNIRVAIKDNESGSIYHEELEFSCTDGAKLVYGEYDDRKEKEVLPGESIRIKRDSDYLNGGRVLFLPDVQTGRIMVNSQQRAYGVPSYRGRMEICSTKQGLVLINELPLEEYLYSVVPSEMPASYPMEALKAQAVCARTYGYRYLEQPGYGNVGAHLDDSVSYQVYNNITENVNSTTAVKETSGTILCYDDKPVNAYYYSTSCGFGADAGVWNEGQKDEMPYLNSRYIGMSGEGDEGEQLQPENLAEEETFKEYILNVDKQAYEREEAWFRWTYEVKEIDISRISDRLKERYQAVPGKILYEEGDEFLSREPKKFKEIYNICCLKRKEGGVMEELLIDTDQGTYKIVSEYNIRYVLNQKGDVLRQDGSVYQSNTLLPSAYLIIDLVKEGENVVGYTLIGGGYGHGVGMSQNGAKAMGLREMDCRQILGFYFGDCQVKNIY